MIKFSAHLTQLFTELPFSERFHAAATNGFEACEFRSPYEYSVRELRAWVREAGIPNILFNAPAGDWAAGDRGIAVIPGREAEFREGIDLALRYADALETPMLHIMAGIAPPGVAPTALHDKFVENLRHAVRVLANSGCVLLIEAINSVDIPGYFLSKQEQAHRIREQVDAPNLLVQMDCYHTRMANENVDEILVKYLPHLGHVQIAGVPGRHEPDTGEFDYVALFKLLEEIGYTGFVGCEYVPQTRTELGLGWMKRLVTSSAQFKSRSQGSSGI